MSTDIDLSGIRRAVEHIAETGKKAEQVMRRARGTLRRRVVPEARREIQADYNLKAGRITKGLTARNTASGVDVIASARGVSLIEYGAKQTATGVQAVVRKGKTSVRPGAFIAPMLGNNKQATMRHGAKRVMTKGRYRGKMRQPLQTQYGPSIAQILRQPERPEHLGEFAQDILAAEIARLLS